MSRVRNFSSIVSNVSNAVRRVRFASEYSVNRNNTLTPRVSITDAAGNILESYKPPRVSEKILNLPSPTIQDSIRVVERSILGDKEGTIQTIKPLKTNKLAGKFVTFQKQSDNQYQLKEFDKKTLSDIPAIVSCGIGFSSSPEKLFQSWFPFQTLYNIHPEDIAVHSSPLEGALLPQRFTQGLPYYYDESYINHAVARDFFNQVFRLRFFNQDGKLKKPDEIPPLLLLNFSIGYREQKSNLNFLYQVILHELDKEGRSLTQIRDYFDKIISINIASPVNWSGQKKLPKEKLFELATGKITPIEAEEYFKNFGEIEYNRKNLFNMPSPELTIGVRSVFDKGTAKPAADFDNFHANEELYYRNREGRIIRPDLAYGKHDMFVLGPGLVPEVLFDYRNWPHLKSNIYGHNLEHYTQAILDNRNLHSRIVGDIFEKMLTDYDKRLDGHQDYKMFEAIYDEDRERSDREWEIVKEEWHKNHWMQTAASISVARTILGEQGTQTSISANTNTQSEQLALSKFAANSIERKDI